MNGSNNHSPGPARKPIVQFRDVTKVYVMGSHPKGGWFSGRRHKYEQPVVVNALSGITVDFYPGEYIAIMGASGSGKSTMLNLLGCLDRPSGGQYILGDRDVAQLSDDELSEVRSRYIGFIFQSYNLIQQYTVTENIQLPLTYQGSGEITEAVHVRTEELARMVGLHDRLDHRPTQLSGGQQQRVAIARSLINDPFIILADEATGNLDTKTSRDVIKLFRQLNQESEITVILVTHDQAVAHTARRIVVLRDGEIVKDSTDFSQAMQALHASEEAGAEE